jgi:hypothetical protein
MAADMSADEIHMWRREPGVARTYRTNPGPSSHHRDSLWKRESAGIFGVPETVYGPNGNPDPAVGLVEREHRSSRDRCGASIMVRADDAETGRWSIVLDASPGCLPACRDMPLESVVGRCRGAVRIRCNLAALADIGYLPDVEHRSDRR